MHIRPARVDEAEALTELALRSKAHWGYDEAFMERCRRELTVTAADVRRGLTFVLEYAGRLQGFYALEPLSCRRIELALLFVAPDALGRGYGRALIAHALGRAAAHGCTVIEIQGDPHARGFYEAVGARLVGEAPSESIPGRMLPSFELSV